MRQQPSLDLVHDDCLEALKKLPDHSIAAIITDPPYGLSSQPDMTEVLRHWLTDDDYQHKGGGFMGKTWDSFVPGPSVWKECFRVLKPGGHLLSFFGTRTQDIGTLAIRLAGFEVRDSIAWVYGSGMPKSHNVCRAINKEKRDQERSGGDGQWQGWGTALKPALEPITVARKPLEGTVATNVLAHGTGGMNVDACRIPVNTAKGRWPANLVHDGSDEVLSLFPNNNPSCKSPSDARPESKYRPNQGNYQPQGVIYPNDNGTSAARFFYCAKASRKDRGEGNDHPTVKPTELMRWLVRLVTPPGGVILDPYMGSGSTGKAALIEGFSFIGIDSDPDSVRIAKDRLNQVIQNELMQGTLF